MDSNPATELPASGSAPGRNRMWLCPALGAAVGAAVVLFVWGALQQGAKVNTDITAGDQSAYIFYARKMAESNFHYVGGRARMPVYPSLMALFLRDSMTDETYFELGKNLGIVIALLALSASFAIMLRRANPWNAAAATLIAAFTVFVFKAPYFQAEPLFYGVNFALFALMISMIRHPRLRIAILAGLVAGIGHLTKASVLPGIGLCSVCLVIRAVIDVAGARRIPGRRSIRAAVRPLACAAIFLCLFLLVVFPYIRTSKRIFGQYFYNVTTTFYVWYDSWHDVLQGTGAHRDQFEFPDMPSEELPTFEKYVREHKFKRDMVGRVKNGVIYLWENTANSYGYAEFVYFYFLAALAILFTNLRKILSLWRDPVSLLTAFFLAAYFGGYLLSYAWYVPIAIGNRFVLGQFLPFLFLAAWFFTFAQKHGLGIRLPERRLDPAHLAPVAILLLLAYLASSFPQRIGTMYGGG